MANDPRIAELLEDYEDHLTAWEVDFLESLDNRDGELTPRQEEVLDGIYARATAD